MIYKFTFALAFVVVANAAYSPVPVSAHAAPIVVAHKDVRPEVQYPHAQYKYSYDVGEKLTGDFKSQHEERNGNVVRGEYSLMDADGYKRTVKYTADHNGYKAVVNREPFANAFAQYVAPALVKTAAPTVHAAPTVNKPVAPVANNQVSRDLKPAAPLAHYKASGRYTSYDAPIYMPTTKPAQLAAPYASYSEFPFYSYHY